MTPEAQRIAIAKACPFVQSSPTCDYVWTSPFGGLTRFNPLSDLNAMHEAEKVLFGRQDWAACKYEEALHEATTSWTFHATADQRARAFLQTLNLWTP